MGVNDGAYTPATHDHVSNASCPTMCMALLFKVLHDAFGISRGPMTMTNSLTDDQRLNDAGHHESLRVLNLAEVIAVK